MHGHQVRVYYSTADISDEIGEIDLTATADVHDRTTFADAGVHTFDPGLLGWTATFTGFYDSAAGQLARLLETLLGNNASDDGILSIYDGNADAVGDKGLLGSVGRLSLRGQPARVNDLVRLSGTIQGSGRIGLSAVLLHPLGTETVTGNGTSVDNGASSANGGRSTLHTGATTGTWTVKVQHSTDNAIWADLTTHTIGSFNSTIEVTGTVNQYLRATWTEDVAGTTAFVLGFSRY